MPNATLCRSQSGNPSPFHPDEDHRHVHDLVTMSNTSHDTGHASDVTFGGLPCKHLAVARGPRVHLVDDHVLQLLVVERAEKNVC